MARLQRKGLRGSSSSAFPLLQLIIGWGGAPAHQRQPSSCGSDGVSQNGLPSQNGSTFTWSHPCCTAFLLSAAASRLSSSTQPLALAAAPATAAPTPAPILVSSEAPSVPSNVNITPAPNELASMQASALTSGRLSLGSNHFSSASGSRALFTTTTQSCLASCRYGWPLIIVSSTRTMTSWWPFSYS